ncbi:MAG: CbiX/SirB N-terminal domain-containing protein [Candidatus Hodarchaeota archaeon]
MIVLAMHGAPPRDFPKDEMYELFNLHSKIESKSNDLENELKDRLEYLETKMKNWKRNEQNDPYYIGSITIANNLQRITKKKVFVGFNEFCSPTIQEAIKQAIDKGAERIFVVTTMLTRGGDHAENDIPKEIEKAKQKYPNVDIHYIWPLNVPAIAQFLHKEINNYTNKIISS